MSRMVTQTSTSCALYTRKSSEESLEQEFNPLDAQREACKAYIGSLRQQGWSALVDANDYGGFSGGTLKRAHVNATERRSDARYWHFPDSMPVQIESLLSWVKPTCGAKTDIDVWFWV